MGIRCVKKIIVSCCLITFLACSNNVAYKFYSDNPVKKVKPGDIFKISFFFVPKRPVRMAFYEDASDSLYIASFTHSVLEKKPLILSKRDGEIIDEVFSPENPYRFEISGEVKPISNSNKYEIVFDKLGRVILSASEEFVFTVHIFPKSKFLDPDEGFMSEDIKILIRE